MNVLVRSRPRILLVAGYFDWFSGYQETVLAAALAELADVEVMASDRVSPAFSDEQLALLGVDRWYETGSRQENGVLVTRHASHEKRSMVWSSTIREAISARPCDLIIQVMPGQIFSAAPTLAANPAPRIALYGDNRAMWSELSTWQRPVKGAAFALTKGLVYLAVNSRCSKVYAYTPNTQRRLRPFSAGRPLELMPLAYSSRQFYFDQELRTRTRQAHGFGLDDIVIVSAGRLERRKRLEWLVEAFTALAARDPRLQLLLLGADATPYAQELRRRVESSAVGSRIRLEPFGDLATLNAAFNAADLGVWPRQPAITIQQAMGTGLFVLLPDNDTVRHLVEAAPASGRCYPLRTHQEVSVLTEVLRQCLGSTPFSPGSRRKRVEASAWLRADSIAARTVDGVLADA